MIPNTLFFFAILAIANAWVIIAFVLEWPGRPDVFSQYALGQNIPVVLYIGSAPQRRAEFYIDYTLSVNGHVAPLYSTNADNLQSNQPGAYLDSLFFRTGNIKSRFYDENVYAISERALVREFGVVDFCNGYIFPERVPNACQSRETLIEMSCGDDALEECSANVNVLSDSVVNFDVPMKLSVVTDKHIFPETYSTSTSPSFTLFSGKTGPLKQNITARAASVDFIGDSVILSLPRLQSSFTHTHELGNITVYQLVTNDENTEALFYSVFVILTFAYWVHVSRSITKTLFNEGTEKNMLKTVTSGFPSLLIANVSGSLAVAGVLSSIPFFSHAHVFLPVEATILLGKYGDYYSSFWSWLYPIYQLLASIVVLLGCLFMYSFRQMESTPQVGKASSRGGILKAYFMLVPGNDPVKQPVPLFIIPAMRYCFELQLLNAAFTTVPPPAGAAFRITMGGFIAIALQCIFGRDANFIFDFRSGGNWGLQLFVCILVLLVSSISLFYNTVLMMAPLLWVTNVTGLDLSLGVAASFLVTLTAASFVVSRPSMGQPSAVAQKFM